MLDLSSAGDIDDGTRNQNAFLGDKRLQTDFHRKLGAVLATRDQVHSRSHRPLARLLDVAGTVLPMRAAKALVQEHLDEFADHLSALLSEHAQRLLRLI